MMSVNMFLCLILLLLFILKLNGTFVQPPTKAASTPQNRNINLKSRRQPVVKKYECKDRDVLCNFSIDCLSTCNLENNTYECKIGRCQPLPKYNSSNAENADVTCNNQHGLFRALENLNALGSAAWTCISLYPELWNDRDVKNSAACQGGTLNTAFIDHVPAITDCQCPQDTSLAYFSARQVTLFSPQVPVCLPTDKIHLYPDYTIVKAAATTTTTTTK